MEMLLQGFPPILFLLMLLAVVRVVASRLRFRAEDELRITDSQGRVMRVRLNNVTESQRNEEIQKLTVLG